MADKYNGMKRAKDWVGQRVALVREISNGYVTLPAGYAGKVTAQSTRGLDFTGEACGCCGVRPKVTRLGYYDVALTPNGEVRGASVTAQPACIASSAEGATSTVVLGAGRPGKD